MLTLDEWMALSAAEHNARRQRWEGYPEDEFGESAEWMELLEEARDRFERQYGSHPLINHIDTSASFPMESEPSIYVTTALYSGQSIEELPDRFCTFAVVQDPILDIRDAYLRDFVILFAELLGWDEEKTREWALRWDDGLNGSESSLFYHEDPYYYALPEVIHVSVPDGIADFHQGMKLEGEVRIAIGWPHVRLNEMSPGEWIDVRECVNAILATVGGRLPIS